MKAKRICLGDFPDRTKLFQVVDSRKLLQVVDKISYLKYGLVVDKMK